MLFNSEVFIGLFLPAALLVYYVCGRHSLQLAVSSLILFSSVFYAWHKPIYLCIVFASVLCNFAGARMIQRTLDPKRKKKIFVCSIILNVLILVYYKYTFFLLENLSVFGVHFKPDQIVLPLGISFFTFQQISFLVDTYKNNLQLPILRNYGLYILFFPQLIAGPILRHNEFFPQLNNNPKIARPHAANLAIGFTIFILGLYKKAVLADGAALIANPIFVDAEMGISLPFFRAWVGTLAFSFQIYFDFSGYSDMAVGLARLFNFQFPINFNSPYKAESITDFWRRWHISLSRFLRDYLYIPLGGNRQGPNRRMANLLITMLIGGLWHGASWTFLVWGGLHGMYLAVNHWFRTQFGPPAQNAFLSFFKRLFVFLLVSVTWLFFRAQTFSGAFRMLKSLFCIGTPLEMPIRAEKFLGGLVRGLHLDHIVLFNVPAAFYRDSCLLIVFMFVVSFFFPNVYEWTSRYKPAFEFPSFYGKSRWSRMLYWRPTWYHLTFIFILLVIAFTNISQKMEFIYFQF